MMAQEINCGQVLEHLMFQKAVIEDDTRESRLDSYLRMVEDLQHGVLVPSEDPFERSVALVFELVVQQRFDPWDINLIEFAKMYTSRVKKATEINLIIAGKIVYMAWEILRLQSEQALQRADRPEKVDILFDGWNPEGFDLFVDPFELGAGEAMLHAEEMPIDEKIRRKSDRPVTLIDLLDAFEEAKKESDIRQELSKFMQKYKRPDFDDKAHKESLEDDIALFEGGKDDRITVFVAALFLARMGKISVWQEKVPEGEIFLEVRVAWDIAQIEDAAPVVQTNSAAENVSVVK
ncbi:MAG: hypothetical protein MUE55_02305 [Thermoplasmata archaeon]|nr:hypothetical protein [Thermoplasmata archaeon]